MAGTLLVARLDMQEVRVVERVVGGQVGAAGNAEDVLDTFGLQCFAECIGGAHESKRVYQRVFGVPAGFFAPRERLRQVDPDLDVPVDELAPDFEVPAGASVAPVPALA